MPFGLRQTSSGKWQVINTRTKRVLGTHDTKGDAAIQLGIVRKKTGEE